MIPEKKKDSLLQRVVAINYEEIVFDKSKDVFLVLTTSYCTKCKKMIKLIEELVSKYQELDENILFATLDVQKNDVFELRINNKDYPSFRIFPQD